MSSSLAGGDERVASDRDVDGHEPYLDAVEHVHTQALVRPDGEQEVTGREVPRPQMPPFRVLQCRQRFRLPSVRWDAKKTRVYRAKDDRAVRAPASAAGRRNRAK